MLAYRDEVVGWLKKLTDEVHEHDCAVMIQLTHLGRRTGWNKGDWLPVVSASHEREAAHRAFPKVIEDWDCLDRIYRAGVTKKRLFDQVVINHGTRPLDELYFELKPQSGNLGEVDHGKLIAGTSQVTNKNVDEKFVLYRIGDAVAARNTHAAIYDALRLMKDV